MPTLTGPIAALISLAACVSAVRSEEPPTSLRRSDIVIVGAGIAGLCAGLESARAGATVRVIDMASVFGGHAVMSSGMVCMVGTPEQQASGIIDSVDLASRDFVQFGEDADADWVRFYVKNSRHEVYDWLHDLGIKHWDLFPQIIAGNSVRRQHVAQGRGVGLVTPIYRECLRYSNLSFLWDTKVTGLLIESNRVTGVRAVNQRTGQTNEFRSEYVVLATGGFESNLELVRTYWPHYFPELFNGTRILLGSGINSLGSGLDLVADARGSLTRLDHQLFYSTGLVNPRDPTGKVGNHAFNPQAIWVNKQGRRFVRDGAPDPKTQMPAVLKQSPATYWAIFDAASRPQFFVSGSDWDDTNVVQQQIFDNPKLKPWVNQADSIEALAQAAGLPPALVTTVQRWNEMVDRGEDTELHRFDSSTSERPLKIGKPPFYAVQFFPLARKSMGGAAVDLSCRVLDNQRQPVPGLYAAGELTGVGGINGKAALEGTMLGPSIWMGRVAAKDIVARLAGRLRGAQRIAEAGTIEGPRTNSADTLRDWREVLRQLIAQPRPGYLHFEKVHAVVLAKNYDCAQCHRESSPLALTGEQLDRRALLQACPVCHGGVKE